MTTAAFSRINLWIDDANGACGWMVRATRTDGSVVEEPIGSLQGEVRGRYELPRMITEDAADAIGLSHLPSPRHWAWTGEVYTVDLDADPTAAVDSSIEAAADEWQHQGGSRAISDIDIEAIADKHGVDGDLIIARARALGVPVL